MEKDWKVLLVLSILLCFISYNFAISYKAGTITYDNYQINNVIDMKRDASAYIKINNIQVDNNMLQSFTVDDLKGYNQLDSNANEILFGTPDFKGKGPDYKMINLNMNKKIKSLLICGKITTRDKNDFARIILTGKDKQNNEHKYLIFDTSLLFSKGYNDKGQNEYEFYGVGEETLSLPEDFQPEKIIIEGSNSNVNINTIYYLTCDDYKTGRWNLKSFEYYLNKQNNAKIEMINYRNKKFGYKWTAGNTGVSHYPYEIKRGYLGNITLHEKSLQQNKNGFEFATMPNTYGIFYYKNGIFSIEPLSISEETLTDDSDKVSYSWRNAHGQNWMTSVKDQEGNTCDLYAITGQHEAIINTYFNRHINKDLSEEQLKSVAWPADPPCNDFHDIYYPIIEYGQVDEECYPFGSGGMYCNACSDWENRAWKIDGHYYSQDMSAIDSFQNITQNGPMVLKLSILAVHYVVATGFEYYPSNGLTIYEIKNSWGTSWGDSGYGYISVPADTVTFHVIETPEVSAPGESTTRLCTDNDDDGYCWWGISDTKPSTCPSSCDGNDIEDCDDSNINKHGFIDGYICTSNSNQITSCRDISSSGIYTMTSNILSGIGTCINILSDDVIINCANYNISNIDGTAININGHSHITIMNCNISNTTTGINISDSSDVILTENVTVTNSNNGIWIKNSNNIKVELTGLENNDVGINLIGTTDSMLLQNSLKRNHYGIILNSSSNNNLIGNVIKDSLDYGIYLTADSNNNLLSGTYSCNSGSSDINDEGATNIFSQTACDTSDPDGICDYSCTSIPCTNIFWPDTYDDCSECIRKEGNSFHILGNVNLCSGNYTIDLDRQRIIFSKDDVVFDCNGANISGVTSQSFTLPISYDDSEMWYAGLFQVEDGIETTSSYTVKIKDCNIKSQSYGVVNPNINIRTIIENVTFYDTPISLRGNVFTVNNSKFYDCGHYCMLSYHCWGYDILNSYFENCPDKVINVPDVRVGEVDIYNCTFNNTNRVFLKYAGTSKILNSTFENTGLYLGYSTGATVSGNTFHQTPSGLTAIELYNDDDSHIENNTVFGSSDKGLSLIYYSTGTTIKNNTLCSCSSYDIYTDDVGSNDFLTNYCSDSSPSGLCSSRTYYYDGDDDGYGDDSVTMTAGCPPSGYVMVGGDCNDSNPDINPGATEVCDGFDNDCNGEIDDGLPTYIYYADSDGDTYGNPDSSYDTCHSTPPSGYVTDNMDCNDSNPDINPGETEVCNGVDDNCDGNINEGFDSDSDTYTTCGYSTIDGSFTGIDCNDDNFNVNPGKTEACNGVDDNCDGRIDEGFDLDGDGYTLCGYNTTTGVFIGVDCDETTYDDPAGVTCPSDPSDCDPGCPDDGTSACAICINPGHTTECCGDGVDNNCNDQVDGDDVGGCTPLGVDVNDLDGDGYNTYIDCNDLNPDVHPGAEEVCNGIDDNCNYQIDEGFDNDHDGYTVCGYDTSTGEFIGEDCDDHNSNIHPGAHEILNKKDDDCDGWIDEGTGFDDTIRPVFPKIPVVRKKLSPRFLPFIYLPMQ